MTFGPNLGGSAGTTHQFWIPQTATARQDDADANPQRHQPPQGKKPLPTSAACFNHRVSGIVGVDPHIDHPTGGIRIHSTLRPSRITRAKRDPIPGVGFSINVVAEGHIRVDKPVVVAVHPESKF